MDASFSSNKPYMLRAVYEWILDNDATPYLLVDATKESVTVPQQYIQNGQIVLNVEPNAIQNWFVDNDAISFSARFSGKAMNIFVPMSALLAIYAQENGEGMVFPPEEVLIDDNLVSVTALDPESTEIGKDAIFNIDTKSKDENKERTKAEVVSLKTKKKSHLKVIK